MWFVKLVLQLLGDDFGKRMAQLKSLSGHTHVTGSSP